MVGLVKTLLQAKNQAHIYHWSVKNYAQHNALQEFYEQVTEDLDRLVETYQGSFELIDLTSEESIPYESTDDIKKVIVYFNDLKYAMDRWAEEIEKSYGDRSLNSIMEDIIELVNTTLYKLKYLG